MQRVELLFTSTATIIIYFFKKNEENRKKSKSRVLLSLINKMNHQYLVRKSDEPARLSHQETFAKIIYNNLLVF